MLSMSERVPKRQRTVNPRGPVADAFSALVVQVLKLAAALDAAGNALARPAGQSTARWQVLAAVEDAPMSVAAIARALSHTRQSVQRVADVLVADGVATYSPNPAHQRAKLLELTPAGLRALRTIQGAQADWARAVSAGLEVADLDAAAAVLADLERRLEAVA